MQGCRRDFEIANWDVDVLAPVAHGSINFSDYTPEENVFADGNQLIHLTAEETLISLGLDTLIGIPDYSIDTGFVVPVSLSYPPGVPFFIQEEETKFNLKDVELKQALIRESSITIFLENTIDKPVLFQYGIYSATLDGDTFYVEARVEANDTLNRSYNLDGYSLDLRGSDGTDFNTVVTFFQAMIHPDETANHQFKAGDQFNVKNTVTNVIPEYVTGYFGNQSVLFNEEEGLDVFNQFPFDHLNITDFDVSLTVDNGIGADLRLNVTELSTQNSITGESEILEHQMIGNDQLYTRAIDLYDFSNPVKHIQQEISFTADNSNLDKLLEIRPDNIKANLDIEVNPLGDISLGNDFAYYGHNLSAIMNMDVPLIVSASGVLLSDTSEFSFNAPEPSNPLDRVNQGLVRLIVENWYPIDAEMQIFLLDSMELSMDSLLTKPTLIGGAIEELGSVGTPTKTIVEIPIDQPLFDELELTSYLRVRTELNTTGMDTVHLRSDGRIDYKLVLDLNANTRE